MEVPAAEARVITKREKGYQPASLPANGTDIADLEGAGLTDVAGLVRLPVDDQPVLCTRYLRGWRDRRVDLVRQILERLRRVAVGLDLNRPLTIDIEADDRHLRFPQLGFDAFVSRTPLKEAWVNGLPSISTGVKSIPSTVIS